MRENESLTPKKRKAIAALITETTQRQAAQTAGISEATLYRWLADDDFQAALAKAEAQATNEAIRHLIRMQNPAAAVIAMTLKNDDISAGVRLRAAISVFDLIIKLKTYAQLEQRLAEVERLLNEHQRQVENSRTNATPYRPLRG